MAFDTVEEFWSHDDVHNAMHDASENSISEFKHALQAYLGTESPVFLYNRATTGLTQLLQKTRTNHKNCVLLASLNCPTVIDAVKEAGCTADYFDHRNGTGTIDWPELEEKLTDEHCAIIVPHLYGVPTDFTALIPAAKEKNITVIEDCAHTLGAKINGKAAGTIGDAAIYSFNYDKPISLGGGGAVLINNPALLPSSEAEPAGTTDENKELHAVMHWLAQRRWLIDKETGWKNIYSRILFKTGLISPLAYQEPKSFGPLRARLGIAMLQKYDAIMHKRNKNAAFLIARIKPAWSCDNTVSPAWQRYKWLAPDHGIASMIAQNLQKSGIRAGLYNWPKIHYDNGQEGNFPNAHAIATRAIDLPIHQNMTKQALEHIISELEKHHP